VTSDAEAGIEMPAPGSPDVWRSEAEEVAATLGTDVRRGLSVAEAATRLAQLELEAARRVPSWRKFLGQFADPLIYLLLAADGRLVEAASLAVAGAHGSGPHVKVFTHLPGSDSRRTWGPREGVPRARGPAGVPGRRLRLNWHRQFGVDVVATASLSRVLRAPDYLQRFCAGERLPTPFRDTVAA
jgi:hypothetical protein